jgi:hypothetical protein
VWEHNTKAIRFLKATVLTIRQPPFMLGNDEQTDILKAAIINQDVISMRAVRREILSIMPDLQYLHNTLSLQKRVKVRAPISIPAARQTVLSPKRKLIISIAW